MNVANWITRPAVRDLASSAELDEIETSLQALAIDEALDALRASVAG
jgi:hypothetical protein